MASSLSAKKRIRQNVKCRSRNRWRKEQIKEVVKAFEQAIASGDATAAAEQLRACYKTLDQTAAKGTIHKNTASRRKAALARRLTAIA